MSSAKNDAKGIIFICPSAVRCDLIMSAFLASILCPRGLVEHRSVKYLHGRVQRILFWGTRFDDCFTSTFGG
jgi:hypothetical protein